jgi:endonuclease-3 related protein
MRRRGDAAVDGAPAGGPDRIPQGSIMKVDRTRKQLMAIYRALFKAYGPQQWWPGDSPFEVMVGAVLTQNTAWGNVEKAIANLKSGGPLTMVRIRGLSRRKLAALIRPSGYYTVKAKRISNLMVFLTGCYGGSLARMFRDDPVELRRGLLSVNGIGPETADAIMLYAAGHPVFVVDAYTRRIFSRHGMVSGDDGYHVVQQLFMDSLPRDASLLNEYHALLVRLGKMHCTKTAPRCSGCPLEPFLPRTIRVHQPRPKNKILERPAVHYHI